MSADGMEIPDLSWVVNPWQAAVVLALILAVLVWPGVLAWLNTRKTRTTLTRNNGGGSVKDALDRIERTQAEHGAKIDDVGARVSTLEKAAEKRRRRLSFWR